MIAHRLSTVQDCDLLVIINDGIVTESGTHTELLAKKGVCAAAARDPSGGSGGRAHTARSLPNSIRFVDKLVLIAWQVAY